MTRLSSPGLPGGPPAHAAARAPQVTQVSQVIQGNRAPPVAQRARDPNEPNLPRLLCAKEVAKFIGVHTRTFRRMYIGGKFPKPMKVSQRCYRWPVHVVHDWMRAHGAQPPPELV